MKATILVMAGLLMAGPAVAFGQTSADTAASAVIVTGEVVRLEPGKVLVLRSDGREVTYTLKPGVVIPSDVQMGKTVSVHTEPGLDGASVVTRVTTTSLTPEGQIKRTTEETKTKPSGETTKTTTVSIQGKVQAYLPGKSITVLKSDGTTTTYTITEKAKLPAEIAVGKSVTIRTIPDGTTVETIVIEK